MQTTTDACHALAALSVTDSVKPCKSSATKRLAPGNTATSPPPLDLGAPVVSVPDAKRRRVFVTTISVPANKVLQVRFYESTAVSSSGSKLINCTFECV